MADAKISALTELTTPATDDVLAVVDTGATATKKIQLETLLNWISEYLSVGVTIRGKFAYKDADEVYLGASIYHHLGTTEQIVYWDSQLDYTFTTLAADTVSYLYLDDSAIVTLGDKVLTASELVDSTTAPTWSETKHGWYNGDDRCIFAVLGDGSGNITEFFNDGNLVLYADRLAGGTTSITDYDYENVSIADSWDDVYLPAPAFVTSHLVTFRFTPATATVATSVYRTNGQTGTTGHVIGIGATAVRIVNQCRAISDTSQIIEVKDSHDINDKLHVYEDGWFFPVGM